MPVEELKLIASPTIAQKPAENTGPCELLEPIELKRKSAQNAKTITIAKNGVWTNHTSQVVKTISCVIPFKIKQYMLSVESELSESVEFGMYLKGEMKKGVLVVSEEIFVPKQTVTAASITFNEDSGTEWNGVIHRHPNNCTDFSSGVDEVSINQNHMFSLLFVNGNITRGVVNVDVKDVGRVQLPLTISFIGDQSLDISMFEGKIMKKKYTHVFSANQFYGGYESETSFFHRQANEHCGNTTIVRRGSNKMAGVLGAHVNDDFVQDDEEVERILQRYEGI